MLFRSSSQTIIISSLFSSRCSYFAASFYNYNSAQSSSIIFPNYSSRCSLSHWTCDAKDAFPQQSQPQAAQCKVDVTQVTPRLPNTNAHEGTGSLESAAVSHSKGGLPR